MASKPHVEEGQSQACKRPSDAYEEWFRAYDAADANNLVSTSDVILLVKSDELDYRQIEYRVQALIPNAGVSDGFCVDCRHIFQHWPELGPQGGACTVARYCHTEQIDASSRAGCRLCAFLLSRLRLAGLLVTFRQIEARFTTLNNPGTTSLSIQNWGGSHAKAQLLWLNFPGKVGTRGNAQILGFQSHVVPATVRTWYEPMNPLEMAKVWLSECTESHTSCHSLVRPQWPGRLISLGDNIKLVETKFLDSLPQYAALSYCWGQNPFMMLTPKTLPLFLEKIPFEDLPLTFRDAIHVAKRLGLSHIWIDALCIIQDQDDHSDWMKESSRMRSVYGGSYVTIAASSSTAVHQGFSSSKKYSGGFYARVITSKYCRVQSFHSARVYAESCTQTNLAGRGWALQERLLSPRTLHFGNQGVFWECRSMIKSESLPEGYHGKVGTHLVCPEDKPWDWSEIISNYSKASLSYGSDRLPALAGIAARQHEVTGDQYLAGMWRKQLVTQLLWRLYQPQHRQKRPPWRAPTWSWVSVDGLCLLRRHHIGPDRLVPYIHVLDAWVTQASHDPFGSVTDGEVTLACSSLVRGYVEDSCDTEELGLGELTARISLTGSELQPFPITFDCLEDKSPRAEDLVYLLPVLEGFSGHTRRNVAKSRRGTTPSGDDPRSDREQIVTGIVLRRVLDTQAHFHRLGYFHFSSLPGRRDETVDEGDKRDYYHEFMQVLNDVGEATAESSCVRISPEPGYPKQQYSIKIK